MDEFLDRSFQQPHALLKSRFPELYTLACKVLGKQDVSQACVVGLMTAAWRFKFGLVSKKSGQVIKFPGYALMWQRAEVGRMLRPYNIRNKHLNGAMVLALVGDPGLACPDAYEGVDASDERRAVRERMRQVECDPFKRLVFRIRYGMDDEFSGEKLTLDEMAAMFGITRERIRQVCHIVWVKLIDSYRR